ncbi:MAG: lycopene cyclase family protein, partial [Verrucomicrobiota bacterium]
GTPVETVTRSEEHGIWRARGGERSWSAREVIDCRPPSAERLARATLQQVFIGVEVECEAPLGRGRPVGLMEHLRATAEAVCFDYVLPLSEHRLLVEATRFARPGWQWDDLEADLAGALQRAGVRVSDPVLRSERGVIPMGLPSGPSHPAQGWTVAGTAGGAVRAATGYAFAGIEDWAAACAVALGEGGNALPARSGSPFQRTMDGLFLRALRREPWRGPGWFLALAERVEPTRLTRFLAGKPRAADWWAVVRALPAGPMLAACRAPTAPRKGEVTA